AFPWILFSRVVGNVCKGIAVNVTWRLPEIEIEFSLHARSSAEVRVVSGLAETPDDGRLYLTVCGVFFVAQFCSLWIALTQAPPFSRHVARGLEDSLLPRLRLARDTARGMRQ